MKLNISKGFQEKKAVGMSYEDTDRRVGLVVIYLNKAVTDWMARAWRRPLVIIMLVSHLKINIYVVIMYILF